MMAQVDTMLEIGKQVPALAILVGVVWMFLKTIKEMQMDFLAALKNIQAENIEARTLAREATKENTLAAREMTTVLTKLLMSEGIVNGKDKK